MSNTNPPVVFLDLDGVVYTLRCDTARPASRPVPDPVVIGLLRRLAEETGCLFVITSSKRITEDRKTILDPLTKAGLPAGSIHPDWATPVHDDRFRGAEVQAWLFEHPFVVRYACIDDDRDYLPGQLLVWCDTYDGMGFRHYLALKALLKGEPVLDLARNVVMDDTQRHDPRIRKHEDGSRVPGASPDRDRQRVTEVLSRYDLYSYEILPAGETTKDDGLRVLLGAGPTLSSSDIPDLELALEDVLCRRVEVIVSPRKSVEDLTLVTG